MCAYSMFFQPAQSNFSKSEAISYVNPSKFRPGGQQQFSYSQTPRSRQDLRGVRGVCVRLPTIESSCGRPALEDSWIMPRGKTDVTPTAGAGGMTEMMTAAAQGQVERSPPPPHHVPPLAAPHQQQIQNEQDEFWAQLSHSGVPGPTTDGVPGHQQNNGSNNNVSSVVATMAVENGAAAPVAAGAARTSGGRVGLVVHHQRPAAISSSLRHDAYAPVQQQQQQHRPPLSAGALPVLTCRQTLPQVAWMSTLPSCA